MLPTGEKNCDQWILNGCGFTTNGYNYEFATNGYTKFKIYRLSLYTFPPVPILSDVMHFIYQFLIYFIISLVPSLHLARVTSLANMKCEKTRHFLHQLTLLSAWPADDPSKRPYLHSHNHVYLNEGSSGQQQVTGALYVSITSHYWLMCVSVPFTALSFAAVCQCNLQLCHW